MKIEVETHGMNARFRQAMTFFGELTDADRVRALKSFRDIQDAAEYNETDRVARFVASVSSLGFELFSHTATSILKDMHAKVDSDPTAEASPA